MENQEPIEEKKTTYTPAMKNAIYKHRENHRDDYNKRQRDYYTKFSENEDWKQKFNERCREANRKYREKKRGENPPRPRGRPRKIIEDRVDIPICV